MAFVRRTILCRSTVGMRKGRQVSPGMSGNRLSVPLETWNSVTRRQASGSEFDEVCIRHAIERDHILPTPRQIAAEFFCSASRGSISDEHFMSQACNQPVSLFGQRRCDASMIRLERRKKQEPPLFQFFSPHPRDAHLLNTPGKTDNDQLRAAQQQVETLLLHWRVKAADDWDTSVA